LEACLDEEELVGEVLVHLGREHPMMDQQQQEAQVHERVTTRSYRYEYLEEVYAGGAEPDEEFASTPTEVSSLRVGSLKRSRMWMYGVLRSSPGLGEDFDPPPTPSRWDKRRLR